MNGRSCAARGWSFLIFLIIASVVSNALAAPPGISGFNPQSVIPGAILTIDGAGFSTTASENIVWCGSVRAEVISASETSLAIRVPAGAIYGPISVSVQGLTTSSTLFLNPTFSGDGSTISSDTLVSREDIAVGDGPVQTRLADLDGDGRADLVLWNTYAGVASLFRSVASPGSLSVSSFEPPVDLPTLGAGDAYGCITSDLDGDGALDLVLVDGPRHRLAVYHNRATPGTLNASSFAEPFFLNTTSPQHVYSADLDGDGRPELLAVHPFVEGITAFPNVGESGELQSSSFAPSVHIDVGTGVFDLAIQDLDADGKPELAVAARGQSIVVFRNVSTLGAVTPASFLRDVELEAPGYQIAIVAADVDRDGIPDLVSGGFSSVLSVFRGHGGSGPLTRGSFGERVDFGTPGWVHNIALGDLNGDAKPDLVLVGELGSYLAVFENLSTPGSFTSGSLASRVDFSTGWNAWGVSVGDIDGDRRSDVVFCNAYDDTITFYRNQSPNCIAVPANAVAWWRAEENAMDTVGSNHASLQGGVLFAPGLVGDAFQFDGTDDYLTVPPDTSLDVGVADGFTIEGWVRPEGTGPLLKWARADVGPGFSIGTEGKLQADLIDTSATGHAIQSATGLVRNGEFQHVALTYDKISGVATIYHDGTAAMVSNLGSFTPQTAQPLSIGRSLASLEGPESFYGGLIDELTLYSRALTADEIAALFAVAPVGKCGPQRPLIRVQPLSQTVFRGETVTFSVGATGTEPLHYQWRGNGTDIAGATETSLTLENVQLSDAGVYSVTVANVGGVVTSGGAHLSVQIPQPMVRLSDVTQLAGLPVSVPVILSANGNENSLSFSVRFDPTQLTFDSIDLGTDAPDGLLLLNLNEVANGLVGVALAMPPDTAFAEGTLEVLLLNFATTVGFHPQAVGLFFRDSPIARQLADVQAHPISANFVDGTVTLLSSPLEGDSAPRPEGDFRLGIVDWVQVGRFAVGLDEIGPDEFQRADCAPRETLGDGQLKVTDWVQAGRYAAALDPSTLAGGPTEPLPAAPSGGGASGSRIIRVGQSEATAGGPVTVPILFEAQGDENALGFTLVFDSSNLAFSDATKGNAASSATLQLNSRLASRGQVGFLLALPLGASFSAGTREVIRLTLQPDRRAGGTYSVEFAPQPVALAVSDASAHELSASYISGSISIPPLPVLDIRIAQGNVILTWPASSTGYQLQACDALSPGPRDWILIGPAVPSGDKNVVVQPLGEGNRYFRLHRP